MFVQPEFLLELNCADFFSTCNYCMLLAKWIPVTCFYLFYTTDDSPFEDDPFDIPDTPPVIQHLTSQSRKEVWDCLVRHAVVQLRGGLVLRSQHPCARLASAQCHDKRAVPSYLQPLCQNESTCETFTYENVLCLQVHFKSFKSNSLKVSHSFVRFETSTRWLGTVLFSCCFCCFFKI